MMGITGGIGWAQCISETHSKASDSAGLAQRCFKMLLSVTLDGPKRVSANSMNRPTVFLRCYVDHAEWAQVDH